MHPQNDKFWPLRVASHLLLQNPIGYVIISFDISLGEQRRSERVVRGDIESLM